MAARDDSARYRYRLSGRLRLRDTRRRVLRIPDVAAPAVDLSDTSLTDDGDIRWTLPGSAELDRSRILMGTADPDNGLRDGDADPDADRAAGAGEQDGAEDGRGERDGDREGATFRVYGGFDPDSIARRRVYLAHRYPSFSTNINAYPSVQHPDTGDAVPTDVEEGR